MGYLKFSEDLFLENQELNRFYGFLFDRVGGFNHIHTLNIYTPGIVKTKLDNLFNNFKVEVGTQPGTIAINNNSFAINVNGLVIYQEAFNNLKIPNDNNWHWVKISHQYTNKEVGTVNIDESGVLSGTNTKFLEVLRGRPNFPVKVVFFYSENNIHEYEVVEVTSDTSALLSGDFVSESNLKYAVLGAFTEDFVPLPANSRIYYHNSCNLQLIPETNNQTPPLINGIEFFIARVKIQDSTVLIEDKRSEIYKEKGDYIADFVPNIPEVNTIIGVESVQWDVITSPKNKNKINIGWGFRTENWTIDPTLRKVTISSGTGGRVKDTSYFNDQDFDGFRLYNRTGKYSKILQSWKSGSQINLILDYLNPTDFDLNDLLIIVPDCEEIEFSVESEETDVYKQIQFNKNFNISDGIGDLWVDVPKKDIDDVYLVLIKYRYKNNQNYSEWSDIGDDNLAGYMCELSFNDKGFEKDELDIVWKTYEDGIIELIPDPKSYANTIDNIYKGDNLEVITYEIPSNGTISLQVGVNEHYQHLIGTANLDSTLIFSLSTFGALNGNKFKIHLNLNTNSNTNGFPILIVQDYSEGAAITPLKIINQGDLYAMMNQDGGICFECTFDGEQWILYQNYDLGASNQLIYLDGTKSALFNTAGWGKVKGLFGHAICEGIVSGAPNLKGRFILGAGDTVEGTESVTYPLGSTGGKSKNEVKILIDNLPNYELEVDEGEGHQHKMPQQLVILEVRFGTGTRRHTYIARDWDYYTDMAKTNLKVRSKGKDVPIILDNKPPYYACLIAKKMY